MAAAVAGSTAGAARRTRTSRSSPTRRRRPPSRSSSPPSRRPRPARASRSASRTARRVTRRSAVIAGLHADIVDLSLEPDMKLLVDDELVATNWNKNAVQRDRHALGRRLRRAPRQPEAHPDWDDLVKPGVAGADAEPVHIGRRALERRRGLRRELRKGKTQGAGDELPGDAVHTTSSSHDSQRATRRTRSSAAGRRPAHVRERGDARANQKGRPRDYSSRRRPFASTTRSRSRRTRRTRPRRRRSHVPVHAAGTEDLGAERLPAGHQERHSKQFSFPNRPQKFTIKYLGGWANVNKKFFDPDNGIMAKIITQR